MTPAAIAGSAASSSTAYTSIVHTKSGIRIHDIPGVRRLWIVTRKLIAPAREDTVSRCSERIQ